ncbi:MAG: MogA/MoaB family molybdenum cofactor biosynthesis protein [Planctomycetes bacterium]|nr:MogA/MoaB family molybdenum cofactor biosynthesis protein [Planctomycetota bacterium]
MSRQPTPPPTSAAEHRAAAPASIACAVVTISDTRTIETDKSGALIIELLQGGGHRVVDRAIVPDEPGRIRSLVAGYRLRGDVQAVLLTGGTGISPRDQTFETITAMLTKPLPGYGELFHVLSYQEIGAAALLSRAVGGLVDGMIVLTMPGSTAAVRLAMEKLILPELGHIVREATKR